MHFDEALEPDDPAYFEGSPAAKERFFYDVAFTLYRRLQLFTALPLEKLDRLRIERLTREIGSDEATRAARKGAVDG